MYKPSGSGQKSQQQILEERAQRFGTKRTHSGIGDTSSKRIRIERTNH
uniref:Uncharacterized protein n=1 Tax=Meloidogyne enterolobii TaxID=390850 RepID=A0A6V7WL54_MELEN|nr:unnamed protein product [Meloidogyne enterolobii]